MSNKALLVLALFGLSCIGWCCSCSPLDSADLQNRASPPSDKEPSTKAEITIEKENKVVRRDSSGRIKWSTPLVGRLGSVRPPELVLDAERVCLAHDDGVTALDRGTGKILWHSAGPSHCLLLSKGLLLATECGSGEPILTQGRFLTARSIVTGGEIFKVRLPAKDFDPQPIREIAGLFLVQLTDDSPGGKGDAWLIDRKGAVLHRFDREVIDGRALGNGRVFLTSKDVVRVGPDDKTHWAIPFAVQQWIAGGGIVDLPSNEMVVFLYGQISDSGVQVMRINPAAGKVVWQRRSDPLGVSHSKYRHRAAVVVEGNQVKVTSQGSFGTFVEDMDLESGRKLKRTRGR